MPPEGCLAVPRPRWQHGGVAGTLITSYPSYGRLSAGDFERWSVVSLGLDDGRLGLDAIDV